MDKSLMDKSLLDKSLLDKSPLDKSPPSNMAVGGGARGDGDASLKNIPAPATTRLSRNDIFFPLL